MDTIEPNEPGPNIFVLGDKGKMGGVIKQALGTYYGQDKVSGGDQGSEIDPGSEVIVLAVSAEEQLVAGPDLTRRWVEARQLGSSSFVVNIHSVQAPVRARLCEVLNATGKPVVVLSLHPMHPPSGFNDLQGQNWVLTSIDVLGQGCPEGVRRCVRSHVGELTNGLGGVYGANPTAQAELLDLSCATLEREGETLDGPAIHDWIVALYQATFHMLKLVPGIVESEEYCSLFSHVQASESLSRSIVEDNPFARALNVRFHERLDESGGRADFSSCVKVLQELILSEEEAFSGVEGAKRLMTVNVRLLLDCKA